MTQTPPPDAPQRPGPALGGLSSEKASQSKRRSLRVMAGAMLAVLVGVPGAIASLFVLDPVFRRGRGGGGRRVRVADLSAVPEDGTPRSFPVRSDQVDGWTGTADVEVGVVFLRRIGGGVVAWNARCPHVGCLIEYKAKESHFLCPCHSSVFAEDGSRENEQSPRAMDTLVADVRDGAVFVEYRDFKYDIAEKVPVS